MTYRELLAYGTRELSSLEDPYMEALFLLREIFEITTSDLFLRGEESPSQEREEMYQKAIKKRKERVPFAYIVGSKEFYGLDFYVNESTLIPRPETEWMVETLVKSKRPLGRVLDMCTGCGAIGIALAKHRGVPVDLADLSPEALGVAKRNVAKHHVEGFPILSDGFSNISKRYDTITVNPPYVPEYRRDKLAPELYFEPDMALFSGWDGMGFISKFIPELELRLTPGGICLMEIDETQGEKIKNILEKTKLHFSLHKDYAGMDRFVYIKKEDL